MPYVMVPCPAEHEAELMQEVLKMTLRGPLNEGLDRAAIDAIIEGLSPRARTLVGALATASAHNVRPSKRRLGEQMDVTAQEVAALADEVNQRCSALDLPWLVRTAPPASGDDELDEILNVARAVAPDVKAALAAVAAS